MRSPFYRSICQTNSIRCFLVVGFMLFALPILAQNNFNNFDFEENANYKIVLIDGSEFVGKFVEKDATNLTISTSSLPKVEIPFSQIKSITKVEDSEFRNGIYWFPNPNATRYFFSPSSFNLKAGEGYYQNSYLVFNSINYGITDFFSIGGGFELISTFSAGEPIYYLTPKVGFELTDNFNVGGGLLFLGAAGETNFGITYGTATYGNRNDNATLGLGWGFFDGEFSSKPNITLSGMKRIKKRLSLVTENWFVPIEDNSHYGILSYGLRFFSERIAVDLGFINNKDIAEGIAIGVPYVDFVIAF